VEGADVVVSATTVDQLVFPPNALDPRTLVITVGAFTADMQELDPRVLERAKRVSVDAPEEVAETGDLLAGDLDAANLTELDVALTHGHARESSDEVLVVVGVGSVTLDAATGETVYRRAVESDDGIEVPL
jgi:alanine dehydrogenase